MSGTPSPKDSSSDGSAASFIKVVQSLIQSDDDQILMQKLKQLQNTFPVLKKITPSLSNQQKIGFFLRDNNFRHRLCQKLLEKFGIEKIPTIKVQLYSIRYRSVIQDQFDETDLVKIFEKFGKIFFIYVEKLFAFIQFQSLISSYIAIKTLNQFQIVSDSLRLSVRWCKPEEETMAEQYFSSKFNSITKAFGNLQKQEKFNCKYTILLQCPSQFKLAQKIIGPKGNNIKKIFETVSSIYKIASIKQLQKNLKIRLRGKGSGYHQGPNGQQSEQILNLCISSKQKLLFDSACIQIQKNLEKLAKDYKIQFQRQYKRPLEGVAYKKIQQQSESYFEVKQLRIQQLPSSITLYGKQLTRPTVNQIQQQINMRNNARKKGNFQLADEIRQKLKCRGVLLSDGTGKKNNYTTRWNYIDE